MKLYICHTEVSRTFSSFHLDRSHFLQMLREDCAGKIGAVSAGGFRLDAFEEAESIAECDLYIALSGMYLSLGFREPILQELEEARKLRKHILVVRPYGTGYLPAELRPYAEFLCGFDSESLKKVLPEI